ncbi:hypothetical protein [Pseudonocardia acidicola]|uniref:STAS domain-containing protein n=1 Tax=Pseudonocardia acidicola TaxID=2724939 RepID=A0ABX1SIN3_9PSEU|nr:hypothetical protein [Pseudonocardia acidicola]NMI00348.1 hypothetical protein [Pseudonocardia acidicola]
MSTGRGRARFVAVSPARPLGTGGPPPAVAHTAVGPAVEVHAELADAGVGRPTLDVSAVSQLAGAGVGLLRELTTQMRLRLVAAAGCPARTVLGVTGLDELLGHPTG